MLRNVTFRMRSLLAVLTMILFAGSAAMAEAPDTPRNLRGMSNQGIEGVVLSWNIPNSSDDPTGFYVFRAEGETEDLNDFELIETLNVDEDSALVNQGAFWIAYLEMEIEEDETYSFYINAFNDDGTSDPSNFAFVRGSQGYPTARMTFTSYPDSSIMEIAVDEEWNYDADAEVTDEDGNVYTDGITYSIMQQNNNTTDVEIDSETGEVSFTSENSGFVHFVIEAVWDEDDRVRAHQPIAVKVRECEIPAVISGTVYDEDGDPVNDEVVKIISKGNNGQNNMNNYYMAWIDQGEFSVEVDAGTYIVHFSGRNYIKEFYEDASNPNDATEIEVDCGDEVSIEMEVTSIDDLTYYTVSGNVSYEDGDPVERALVEFIGINSNSWRSTFTAVTDENGDYEVEVPDIYTYIAVAYNMQMIYNGNDSMFYKYPLYYEQTYDPREATEIEVNEDMEGIDFVFDDEDYTYENEISGTIQNEEDEALEGCFVIAINTERVDNYQYRNAFPVQSDANGSFTLENLIPGTYVLLAFPNNSEYAPGFYVEDDIITWTWEDATEIEIDEEDTIEDIIIRLPLMEEMGGICELRGRIRQNRGQIKEGNSPLAGDVLKGASVYLATEEGNPVKYTSTNEQGEFEFLNVKEGEYILRVDKIGYENYQMPVELAYGERKDMDEISLIEEGTSSVDDGNPFELAVFPNPVNTSFNLTFEAHSNNTKISIVNSAGMEVFSVKENTTVGYNAFNYDVENLSNGTYYVKVQSGSSLSIVPIVIVQ